MKDITNPLLLLVTIVLLSWKVSLGMEAGTGVEIALLTLCVSGFIVNGLLSMAQALARRKAVMSVVWSMVFLIFCSCSWVAIQTEKDYSKELAAYNELSAKWQQGHANPFTLADSEGRSLLELAAILGKKMAVRGLLAQPEAAQAEDIILKAAMHAADNGHHELLRVLHQRQGSFDFNRMSDGITPLIAAVLSDNLKCTQILLELEVDPNMCDENGVSPLMHAVIDDNRRMAALLVQNGADPTQKDNTGRDAFSCSRSDNMDEVLTSASQVTR